MINQEQLQQQALEIVKSQQYITISYLQIKLRIGYFKAKQLLDNMINDGVVDSDFTEQGYKVLKK